MAQCITLHFSVMQPQGGIGYGYWVCHSLQAIDRKLILESDGTTMNVITQRGVLQARDGLDKCVRSRHKDPCAYNYLGLLYEQEGLLKSALMAFIRYMCIACIAWYLCVVLVYRCVVLVYRLFVCRCVILVYKCIVLVMCAMLVHTSRLQM